MRLSTIASIAVLAVSSAALAQVATTPVEQKTGPSNDMPIADNAGATGNDAATNTLPASQVTPMTAAPTEAKPASRPRR